MPWDEMPSEQKAWFWPGSDVASANYEGYPNECGMEGDLQCCDLTPPSDLTFSVRKNVDGATSKQVCECWGGDWDRAIYQRFDNTWVALGCFYEISTTEG